MPSVGFWRIGAGELPPRRQGRQDLAKILESESGVNEKEGVYDENGVDRSLVRWMLSLTPAERLAYAESMRELAERACRGRTP